MTTLPVSVQPSAPSALPPFGIAEIRKRTHAIQEIMRGVMKEGTHYGVIPGTPKPSLWKAGAEVIAMTFRLAPMLESQVRVDDLEAEWAFIAPKKNGVIAAGTCTGFFEVESTCTILGPAGDTLSRCSARCNNREAKYRSLSLFDIRNTIQKMAEKRAFVSAVLMATGASDIFTQDLEDFPELIADASGEVDPKRERKTLPAAKHADAAQAEPPIQTTGNGLSPKREAWLLRVGQEAKMPSDALDRCLQFLRGSNSGEVKAFFDDLARRKSDALKPFVAKAS